MKNIAVEDTQVLNRELRAKIRRSVYRISRLLLNNVIWGLQGIGALLMLVIPLMIIVWAFFTILWIVEFGVKGLKVLWIAPLVPVAALISRGVNLLISELGDKLAKGFYCEDE